MAGGARRTSLFFVCLLIGLGPIAPVRAATNAWTTLPRCSLSDHSANDGDSFYVASKGKSYLFRLYFVDCPETNRQIPSRVTKQAEYWKTGEKEILAHGAKAAEFTLRQLKKPFVIHTRWQDAMGNSRVKRYFAFVTTSAGEDLAAELVRTGYARVYGASVGHPDGTSARAMWRRLDRLEKEAEEAKRGAWDP